MTDRRADPSVFSHGEREIAAMLREGQSVEAIADTRDDPVEVVEKARDRIHEKTERALATLLQSPDVETVAADLDASKRATLRERLGDPD